MRRSTVILAVLGLAISFGARTARADGPVDYTVTGTYAAVTGYPSTPLSTPGDTFTFTFSVDPALLTSEMNGMSNAICITDFDYSDSSGHSFTDLPGGMVTFFTAEQFGLFNLELPMGSGVFMLQLEGPSGFNVGPPLTLATGVFPVTPGDTTGMAPNVGSILGDFDPSISSCADPSSPVCPQDAILNGTVNATPTSMPEPSSVLLLGIGFIALGSFARRRVSTSHN